MYNAEVEARLASVMLLRWHTFVMTGDERGAVSEASNFVASQLSEEHPTHQVFTSLGFVANSEDKLAPLEKRQKLLRQMLDYTVSMTRELSREQMLAEAPLAFYTAALLLEEGKDNLLNKIAGYKRY